MAEVEYDIGFGIKVKSSTCTGCKFNTTKEEDLDKAMAKLREKTAIETKVIAVGSGLGLRLPNQVVSALKFKAGQKIELIRQANQLLIKRAMSA